MRRSITHTVLLTGTCLSLLVALPISAQPQEGVSGELRDALLESLGQGKAYLLSHQADDGTWESNAGITALAATAILRQPDTEPAEQLPHVQPALTYLAELAKSDGGIYERDVPHYVTSVSLVALAASELPEYEPLVRSGQAYLVGAVIDEGEGYSSSDKFYGGLGCGSDLRPDLSNLEHALRP